MFPSLNGQSLPFLFITAQVGHITPAQVMLAVTSGKLEVETPRYVFMIGLDDKCECLFE